MFNTNASTSTLTATAAVLNTLDTVVTATERAARVTATIAWMAALTAVLVTGACINATAAAREAYAQEAIELASNAAVIEAMASATPQLLLAPAADAVTPSTPQLLLPPATTMIDLGPEFTDAAMQTMLNRASTIKPDLLELAHSIAADAGVSVALTADELSALTVKQLKEMAKEEGIKGYSKLRKAALVQALALD